MLHEKALQLSQEGLKPLEIAASLGITVCPLPFKSVKGIALALGKHKLILIDKGLTEMEQQLVCGHELGHFLFHGEANFMFILEKTFFYPKQEYQANLFACRLLLGEKATVYETEIKEAAGFRSLREIEDRIGQLVREDGEEP
jgi:Zn-dependent peptidase ImmA (M78 family)